MAAATTTIPTPWCAAATAWCRWTSTCPAARRRPRRWCTASCSCSARSAAAATSATRKRGSAMSESATAFAARLRARFPSARVEVALPRGEVGMVLDAAGWREDCRALRDEFGFEVLVDLCGVDHLGYGTDEWDTDTSSEGFSRGVAGKGPGRFGYNESPTQQLATPDGEGAIPMPENRFSVVVQLLSIGNNRRMRVTCHAPDDALPQVDSLCDVWPGVNWFEREAFDLFGIVFPGHPDLRRLLTDYGFIGHPFRK